MKTERLCDLEHTMQKYLRIKHLMQRYGCSRGHVKNMVKRGILPPPMSVNGVQQWPMPVIEELDRERDQAYYDQLEAQGFKIPEDAVSG